MDIKFVDGYYVIDDLVVAGSYDTGYTVYNIDYLNTPDDCKPLYENNDLESCFMWCM